MAEQTEQQIQQRIRLTCAGAGQATRLWRNNVGTGWAGRDAQKVTPGNLRYVLKNLLPGGNAPLQPGDVIIRQARPLNAGLCPGSADLIGYVPVTITPEMVGMRVAVFAAVEVKRRREGRATPQQLQWLGEVQAAGGRAGIATSVEEAGLILKPPGIGG